MSWHPSYQILYPSFAMVVLTIFVWVKLYIDRLGEIALKKIKPETIRTSKQLNERLEITAAADHFRNLFEFPVLFYALCGFVAVTKITSSVLVVGAWVYVFARVCHALIHVTYNFVLHRFYAYLFSCLVLYSLWGLFFLEFIALK
eukprot:TRINITY_DN711_c0_g1_i1.p1 TRINITY_DN711_c0_g1~~TRINITY_DN711_c0_g1_i1.p1  ORF type:complete len:145 (-),score=23.76 TRINITY_DN711_c0_g1_i1:104-538(-)